jgi:hypothetical protein
MIFALPEDLIETLKYAKETILEMTSGLEKRLINALPAIYRLKDGLVIVGQESFSGFTIEEFRRKHCPRESYTKAMRILNGLSDAGVLSYRKERGIKIFEVLLTEPESKKLANTFVQGESTTELKRILEKEFEARFLKLCRFVGAPILITRKALENSPYLQALIKKCKNGSILIQESEDDPQVSSQHSESVASVGKRTNRQTVEKEYPLPPPASESERLVKHRNTKLES